MQLSAQASYSHLKKMGWAGCVGVSFTSDIPLERGVCLGPVVGGEDTGGLPELHSEGPQKENVQPADSRQRGEGRPSDLQTPVRHTGPGLLPVTMPFLAERCFCSNPKAAGLACHLTENM